MATSLGSFSKMTLGTFTDALSSSGAVPGGGSAAAIAAALAASLTGMVVRLSQGRPAYARFASLHEEGLAIAEAARGRFLELADEDARAFEAYMAARRLPRDDPESDLARTEAIREAARGATTVPLSIVQECHTLAELDERLAGRINVHAASDLDVSALLVDAAARGAAANAVVNLGAVGDGGFSDAVLAETDQRLRQIQKATARTREQLRKGRLRRPEAA
jgi:glutamate formiminotransferase/formiminotetrahydrofolate cyclodeaminase